MTVLPGNRVDYMNKKNYFIWMPRKGILNVTK